MAPKLLLCHLRRTYATQSQLARWFRAVDEPVSKPKKFNYTPSKQPTKFEAFSSRDSARLEAAFKNGKPEEIVETDGLVTVQFKNKTCAPTYYEGPAFAVRRVLWFEQLNSNRYGLADEPLEHALEAKYEEDPEAVNFRLEVPVVELGAKQQKMKLYQGTFTPPSSDGPVRAVLQERDTWLAAFSKREFIRGAPQKQNEFRESKLSKAEASPASSTAPSSSHPGEKRQQGTREIESFAIRPQFQPRPIEHLIFCVHGIGQLLSLRYEQVNFVKDVDQFRKGMNKAYAKRRPPPEDSNGIQVLPVMWRHSLDDSINGLHPQQLFGSVNVAADVVLDFVMYMQEQHRSKILHVAAEEMRRMYTRFCELNPHFAANPKVSIVGHSLGSVIAHDLVSRSDEKLPFDVTNLFTMGSPVGILELMRQAPTINKGKALSMYNILRRSDPVAARLEPIVTRRALELDPQPLPGGGTNLLKQIRDLTDEITAQSDILSNKATSIWNTMMTRENTGSNKEGGQLEAKSHPPKNIDLPEFKHYNRLGRLDFSVTETMDISLVLGLAGHLMYLDNEDIATFVLSETLKTQQENRG